MAIQTQQSFSGFVASDPQLSRTENGDARLNRTGSDGGSGYWIPTKGWSDRCVA